LARPLSLADKQLKNRVKSVLNKNATGSLPLFTTSVASNQPSYLPETFFLVTVTYAPSEKSG
jgi:hypothetical protein